MNRRPIRVLSALLGVGVLLMTGCAGTVQPTREYDWIPEGTRGNDVAGESFETAAETESLRLEINPDTTELRVTVKQTGYVFSSSAAGKTDGSDRALLSLSYMATGSTARYMNSYDDAVKKGQYTVEPLGSGVQLRFSLGDIEPQYYAPAVLTEPRYQRFYAAMSSSDQRFMRQMYTRVDIANYEGEARRELLQKYPIAEHQIVYILDTSMQKAIRIKLDTALRSAGYTEEDRALDAANGGETAAEAEPRFGITLRLTLEGDVLRVSVPLSEFAYTADFPPEDLGLLPNFGRADSQTDGYWLLPDGSGSLMYFRNGKQNLQEYHVPVYGTDRSVSTQESTFRERPVLLPLFGCALQNGNGYLAVIRDGDALASIHATPGDGETPPSAYAAFAVLQSAKVATISSTETSESYFTTHQQTPYTGELVTEYRFLTDEAASYTGRAALYRSLLWEGHTALTPGELPLYFNLIGEADVTRNTMGIRVRRQQTLTTFEDVQTVVSDLQSRGVSSLSVILSGCLNGGWRQGYLNRVRVSGSLGGEKGLTALAETLRAQGISCALDAEVQYAYDGGLLDGLGDSETVRLLSRRKGLLYAADLAYFGSDDTARAARILNPSAVEHSFGVLRDFLSESGLSAVSLRSVGAALNGDYNEKREVERQTALQRLTEQVAALRQQTDTLILSTGMAPMAVYADTLLALPMTSCRYDITDESVPFAAMVYSGYVQYTGGRINLDFAEDNDWLRLLESGAAPYYLLCASGAEELHGSDLSEWYAVDYGLLREEMAERYAWLSRALDGCYGRTITAHERLASGVTRTTYESGVRLTLNFNDYAVTLPDGQTLAAGQYLREE